MPTLCLWIFSIKAELEPPLGLLGMAAKKIQLDFQGRKKGHIPKEKWTSWLLYYWFSSVFLSAAAPLSLVEPQVFQGFFPGMVWSPGCVLSARLAMCPAPLDCCTLRHLLIKFLPFLVSLSRDFLSCISQETPASCQGDKPEAEFAPWLSKCSLLSVWGIHSSPSLYLEVK